MAVPAHTNEALELDPEHVRNFLYLQRQINTIMQRAINFADHKNLDFDKVTLTLTCDYKQKGA